MTLARARVLPTLIFLPSPAIGSKDFASRRNVARNRHFFSPMNDPCARSPCQGKKIQNYFPFRCAAYQRVNNLFDAPSKFIKKQTAALASYPGKSYLREPATMNGQSNTQEYCRYRDAHHHTPRKVGRAQRERNNNHRRSLLVIALARSAMERFLLLANCQAKRE